MRDVLVTGILLFAALPLFSQTAPAAQPCTTGPRPSFDVVSIKPATSLDPAWMQRTPDGLTITSPLRRVIQYAFNLHDFQLSSGSGWLDTALWEIHAKSDSPNPDFAKLNDAQRQAFYDRQMQQLQSMLIERFHLKCHMTTREMPVYDLVVAKSGSKLKESTADPDKRSNISVQSHGLQSHTSGIGVGTTRLAILLAGPTGRVVIDKTGLKGAYDFTLDWTNDTVGAPETTAQDSPSAPSIYSAVEEQLGLKLSPAKEQVPVLVIDQVDRPSKN